MGQPLESRVPSWTLLMATPLNEEEDTKVVPK